MEKVSVKLVAFKSENEDLFLSYCAATRDFASKGKTIEETVASAKAWLLRLLENRLAYKNLQSYGWEVSENSAKPPIFADEELVRLTEKIHSTKIENPIIVTIDVELPKAQKTL